MDLKQIAESEALAHPVSTETGISYCLGGVAALVVGGAAFGIPCGALAMFLGAQGIKRGAGTFGRIIRAGGLVEVVVTILWLLVTHMR